jgi:hypothetical protein
MLSGLTHPKQPAIAQPPQPQLPQGTQVHSPMVYVYEKQTWQYKVIAKNTTAEELLSEEELNALGVSGWELAAVVTLRRTVLFYFKQVAT